MDNNDSNIKSQQTGGLKLMTVFIAVLALHVVVIGGFTVYHLMSGGTDADLTTTDKNHKALKSTDNSAITDATSTDSTQSDKTASSTPAAPAEVATIPANPSTPAPDAAAPTVTTTPAPAVAPAPAPVTTTPKVTPQTPATDVANVQATPAPAPIAPELVPPAEPNLIPAPMTAATAPAVAPAASVAPVAPVASGPVHMPPAVASTPVREHEQTYIVKITDSYKKIAKAHHVTVAQLKEANHIKGDTLHTGQKLLIPSGKTFVASSTSLDAVPSGPILSESAAPMTTSLVAAPAASSRSHLYTIVKGDTLSKIAHKFKTTTAAIMSENSITDPAKLTIGKKLKIPSLESRSARNNTPSTPQPSQVQVKENAATGQLANFVP